MTPIQVPTNKKMFQTTPIALSGDWDDNGQDSFDGSSIRANSIVTTGTSLRNPTDDSNDIDSCVEAVNDTVSSSDICDKDKTVVDDVECYIETVESISPSKLMKVDDKHEKESTRGIPPLPKSNKFFQSAPIDSSISVNSLLSSAKSTASRGSLLPKPDSSFGSQLDISERSRNSLRSTISHRRHSLTVSEAKFLEGLIRDGTDIDIQKAYEKLLDEDLFFDPVNSGLVNSSSYINECQNSCNYSTGLDTEPPNVTKVHSDSDIVDEINRVRTQSVAGSQASSNYAFGSEKRQEHLFLRRNSVTQKIWTAHGSGIAVSAIASRRSVAQRLENSTNSASTNNGVATGRRRERRYFTTNGTHNNIFRTSGTTSITSSMLGDDGGKVMDDIRSDNNRRTSHRFRRSIHAANMNQFGRRSSLIGSAMPLRQSLRRMKSETNINATKSVTFAGIAPSPMKNQRRIVSEGTSNLVSTKKDLKTINVDFADISQSSIPSIHLASEVRSPSSMASDSNKRFPSIHIAHEVRSPSSSIASESLRRVPSIHLATRVFSDGQLSDCQDEEKKSADPSDTSTTILTDGNEAFVSGPTYMIQEASMPLGIDCPSDEDDSIQRAVILRRASCSNPNEIDGIEVADWETEQQSPRHTEDSYPDLDVVGGSAPIDTWHCTNSFDDSLYLPGGGLSGHMYNPTTTENSIFRQPIRRSLSDESFGLRAYTTQTALMHDSMNSVSVRDMMYARPLEDESANAVSEVSWKMDEGEDEDEDSGENYDAWKVIEDEYENGYGGGGTLPFSILGTSADDVDSHPHVLSPPLMESLLAFVPYGKASDNFWMKYSLVRDGASFYSFLQHARGAQSSFLAVETVDGEVFGAFTSTTWRKNWNYFGSGESFLWRMKHTRQEKSHSIIDQAQMESEIEVFPFTGHNSCIQLCVEDRIAIGGGSLSSNKVQSANNENNNDGSNSTIPVSGNSPIKDSEWGFGLTIENDFIHGTTSPCLTYGSPSLSIYHHDGSLFEIMNMELWALTPCDNVDDADRLELSRLFLEKHAHIQHA
jgi:TLD